MNDSNAMIAIRFEAPIAGFADLPAVVNNVSSKITRFIDTDTLSTLKAIDVLEHSVLLEFRGSLKNVARVATWHVGDAEEAIQFFATESNCFEAFNDGETPVFEQLGFEDQKPIYQAFGLV